MHPNFSQLTPRWFKRAFVYTGNIDDFRYRFEMDKDNGLLHTAVYTVYCFEVAKDVQQQDFPWDDQGVEQLIDSDILKQHVRGCLDKLDPKYREVVQLVYFEHMKYDEVSDILRVPTSTVGVWLSRAKAQLKELCGQQGVKR